MIALFRYAGVRYGILQVVGITLVKLRLAKRNPFSTGIYEQVCSELVAYFLRDVLDQPVGWSFDTATPKDIKEFLDRLNDLR